MSIQSVVTKSLAIYLAVLIPLPKLAAEGNAAMDQAEKALRNSRSLGQYYYNSAYDGTSPPPVTAAPGQEGIRQPNESGRGFVAPSVPKVYAAEEKAKEEEKKPVYVAVDLKKGLLALGFGAGLALIGGLVAGPFGALFGLVAGLILGAVVGTLPEIGKESPPSQDKK